MRSRIEWMSLIPLSVLLMGAADESDSKKENTDTNDAYVLILTPSDSNPDGVLERYPEISVSWDELARFNLLRSGTRIELKRDMLAKDQVLAKIAQSYGETEIRRTFDRSFMPVGQSPSPRRRCASYVEEIGRPHHFR